MELLVVIAVLGVLGSVAVVAVPRLVDQAQVRSCAADRDVLQTAQSAHHIQHGAFATEDELVAVGLISAPSELHDITVSGNSYELVGVAGCTQTSNDVVLTRWTGLRRADAFRFDPGGGISVSGRAERQAIADGEAFSSGLVEIRGARFARGQGWGVVVHAGTNASGQIQGYEFQVRSSSGGEFMLRQRDDGGSPPLATTRSAEGFDWREPHDVRLEIDGNALRASVNGETVMEVTDLAAAARSAGSRHAPRTEGSVGLRLWSSTELEIDSITVSSR